jgi:signal transduction histidine kinase/tetratricopeptide (TPR) repeat protein
VSDGTKKPVFIGRALLLLVPVAVLLVIGLNSLRQDRIQARREAEERARQLAETIAAHAVAMFVPPTAKHESGEALTFRVNASGELLFPPAIRSLTPAPLLISELTPAQAELWRNARQAEMHTNRSAEALTEYSKFLQSNPPRNFEANASYSVALLYNASGNYSEAAQALGKLAEASPEAFAESGMPLRPLAMLKLLELQDRTPELVPRTLLNAICSNLVYSATPLSRALLRQVDQWVQKSPGDSDFNRWIEIWREHERIRGLYAMIFKSNSSSILSHRAFWFTEATADTNPNGTSLPFPQNWVAVPLNSKSANCEFVCYPERQAKNFADAAMAQSGDVAEYFTAHMEVAGKMMATSEPVPKEKPGVYKEELFGSASEPRSGNTWLEAKVYLTQPPILYRNQRIRRFSFGALIVTCAVAALAGLVSNWRAFKRQQWLNELRSNFVSSVSHELRTPVASVRLLVEGLESGRVTGASKQKEYLQLMGQECRRLSGLIDNILDFSRIDDGRKQFEFSATNIATLVSETIKIIEPIAVERKVLLCSKVTETAPPKSNPPILDGLAIRQALLNLIDNAIKHSPEGSTVTVGNDWNGSRHCVSIWVEDKGAGIPPEEHAKIFERFYRRGSELNRETQGIGIGLSIVKHIVEAHGGQVLVQSAVGQGSKFTMELPLDGKGASTI